VPVELPELNHRALDEADRFIASVPPDRLDLPTPCAGWDLGELLRHMVGHNHGWAAAARGLPAQRATWEEATLGDDPYGAYRRSADAVRAAFTGDGLLTRPFDVYGYGSFPGRIALGMHFVDFLVHAWDVARAVGAPGDIDSTLSEHALRIALRWPYQRPDKAFDVRVEVPDTAPPEHRLVAYLGRSAFWPR
jgi:uncharacterized protein (TIGR03086 family)